MKKVINLKMIIVLVISITLIATATSVLATDSVLGTGSNNTATTEVTQSEYDGATIIPQDTNYPTTNTPVDGNSANGNNVSTGTDTSSAYNTVDEEEENLPQTGIEDFNVGILLVICVAAAIYTYKKMRDYKNV